MSWQQPESHRVSELRKITKRQEVNGNKINDNTKKKKQLTIVETDFIAIPCTL